MKGIQSDSKNVSSSALPSDKSLNKSDDIMKIISWQTEQILKLHDEVRKLREEQKEIVQRYLNSPSASTVR